MTALDDTHACSRPCGYRQGNVVPLEKIPLLHPTPPPLTYKRGRRLGCSERDRTNVNSNARVMTLGQNQQQQQQQHAGCIYASRMKC